MSMLINKVKKIEEKINDNTEGYMDLYLAKSDIDGFVKVEYLYTIDKSNSRGKANECLYKEGLKDKVEVMTMEEYKRRKSENVYDNAIMVNVFVI